MSYIFYGFFGEYGFNHTTFSVHNDLRYNTRVTLGTTDIIITVGYNNRTKLRWVDVETSSGDILLKKTSLKFGRKCELLPVSKSYDLDYFLTLKKKRNNVDHDGYNYLNWSNDFELCFVGKPNSSNRKMKENYLNVKVGGRDG